MYRIVVYLYMLANFPHKTYSSLGKVIHGWPKLYPALK